ncbi:MAG: hypothetical protein LBV27_07480 [Oscillospiraceae bacterium]|jgi:hypothetical protein|nr:hypothetical protein [Oscillospiraceae bacterium]
MLETLLMQNSLNINCDIACLINDREGFIDKCDTINLNTDVYIASGAVNAKLIGKKANINADRILVTDYAGEFVQIPGGELGDGVRYDGQFVIVSGDVVLRDGNMAAFENAVEAIVSGTVYYPDSCDERLLARVQGRKRAYPGHAFVVLGNRDLERLMDGVPAGVHSVWVAGEVSVLDEAALHKAKTRDLSITCDHLFIYEGLCPAADSFISAARKTLVPDDYIVTGPLTLNAAAAVLHGTKLYVRGALMLEEKDVDCLGDFESIVVKGCASLPVSCAKAFKAVGRADSYRLFEGRLYNINGFELISHERLNSLVERGEKLTMSINGFAVFAEDVTAGDMDAIAALSCNGFLVLPGEAHGALSARIGSVNGFISDIDVVRHITGLSFAEVAQKLSATGQSSNISTDVFMLT